MTDSLGKRKYAGPTIQERRKADQDPAKIPPHKKERHFRLNVEWTETRVYRGTGTFTTRSARDQAKKVLEREIERERSRVKGRYYGRWGTDDAHHLKTLQRCEAETRLIGEPKYTELEE